jgi:hypothetical protein
MTMSTHNKTPSARLFLLALIVACVFGAASSASAAPGPVPEPAIPGVAPLPGPVAPASKPAARMGILTATPDQGFSGQGRLTISGKGLPASTAVSLQWATANTTWVLDPTPSSVDYLGRKETKLNVVLAEVQTDAGGAFSYRMKVPADFGGIHDIYAVVNGEQIAKGGFLINPKVTFRPRRGPIGTPIHVRFTGLGSTLYGGAGNIYYDSKYTGSVTAIWTRGVANFTIRASGPVGRHFIRGGMGTAADYLNKEQSPVPWAVGANAVFHVTKDNGRPANRVDWPLDVASTISQRTTLQASGLAAQTAGSVKLAPTSGAVDDKVSVSVSGLNAGPVELAWATVVGNRVNCTGQCWSFVQLPLGKATAAADGTVKASFSVPDNLGGWHVVQVLQGGEIRAQVPFYVKRSIVGQSAVRVKYGQKFTVHLKGLGWTQMDNTIAVTYDNGYIGYACGFNSNGDVVIDIYATGAPGTHLIDMYPLLYTLNPSYPNTPFGMVPMLSYAQDFPGLAAGYQLPAMRMAVEVVK